jgi:hypothetical protein
MTDPTNKPADDQAPAPVPSRVSSDALPAFRSQFTKGEDARFNQSHHGDTHEADGLEVRREAGRACSASQRAVASRQTQRPAWNKQAPRRQARNVTGG